MKKPYAKPRCTILPVSPLDPLTTSSDDTGGGVGGGEGGGTGGGGGVTPQPPQPSDDLPGSDRDPYADDRTWL